MIDNQVARRGGRFVFCGLDNVRVFCVPIRLRRTLVFVLIHHSHRVASSDVDAP